MPNLVEPHTLLRSFELVPATEHDRHFDYCLEPYRPRRPWPGKIRGENLLWHSLAVGGATAALRAPLEAVQRHVGQDLTVWGVKWDGTQLWWELYFYDPQKESPEATITSIAAALSPWMRIVPQVRETVPYMMVSFDVSPQTIADGEVRELNLYLTGERAHAGRSYKLRDGTAELENTYRFMEPKREVDDVLSLLTSSLFVDYSDPRVLSRVLLPELFACKKVCIAKKRRCDAIYYSGITVEQLIWFLDRFAYPAAIRGFVRQQRERLEHLYFDVGIDYRRAPDGTLEYPKSSYYGTL
ncbi:hypothetical protein [Sandaracinus amylolyticus]|uniref:Uncharacterized protein n=1 Tax=Sandaracinus amylolyticus TaxID=927083 RepID=A0A0F6YG43_9BACT|nr:hypothetical protein [Sandaracinus amylolyticus]AKF03213.1 hypothetical protein DB32_000362 [Sandaracinus amylolyticus]